MVLGWGRHRARVGQRKDKDQDKVGVEGRVVLVSVSVSVCQCQGHDGSVREQQRVCAELEPDRTCMIGTHQ